MKSKGGRRGQRSSNINNNITELTLEQSLALCAKAYSNTNNNNSNNSSINSSSGSGGGKLIFNAASLQECNLLQEKRQIKIVEAKSRVTIDIAREDFPDVHSLFIVDYYPSAPQAAWAQLLVDITKVLGVEFISCIIDRKDGGFVNRTLSLREGGKNNNY